MNCLQISGVATAVAAANALTSCPDTSWADLAPQFLVQQDLGAVAGQTEIVLQLGVIDKIERTSSGYMVTGGKCSILAQVVRELPKAASGQPIAAPSRIIRIDLGAKQCK